MTTSPFELPHGRINLVLGLQNATFSDDDQVIVVPRDALDTEKLFVGLSTSTVVRVVLKQGEGILARPLLSGASKKMYDLLATAEGLRPSLLEGIHIVGSTTLDEDGVMDVMDITYRMTVAVDANAAGQAAAVFMQAAIDNPDGSSITYPEPRPMAKNSITPDRLSVIESSLERQIDDPADGWRSDITAVELSALIEENKTLAERVRNAEDRLDVAEQFRPEWAKGFTKDSVAAQNYMGAASGMWRELGVDNQTDALQMIKALLNFKAEHDEVNPVIPGMN